MWDFGRAEILESEAIGEPGQRTFRLRIRSGDESASLWLEKEQLAALVLGIRQLLAQTASSEEMPADEPMQPGGPMPEQPQVDFKIGKISLGYNDSERLVALFVYTTEDAEGASPAFTCQASRGQCLVFAERAEEVINAGRPTCVLCGAPIEQGTHQCLRRNGHTQRPLSLE